MVTGYGVRCARAVWGLCLGLTMSGAACAQGTAPTVEKVDPPNWFAGLPGELGKPMLLVRGTALAGAAFSVAEKGVKVTRTQSSANGHWAMVWLDAGGAKVGTVHVTAKTGAGAASFDYKFEARRSAADGPAGFSSKDVLYLIMPDRFADGDQRNNEPPGSAGTYDRGDPHAYHGGDLRGMIDHLDYIQGLGATAVWLTPTLENDPKAKDYHGYHAWNLYALEPRFGTLAEYRELRTALHKRGMKLVFDAVPNHVGPTHPWLYDPPMVDWFHGTAANHQENKYQFHPETDPNAAPGAAQEALDGWFVNLLPDMNQENPAVALYETENMAWWIEEAGIDGLRIDTFPYVPRTFWQSYLGTLKLAYPRLTSVGEVSDGDATVNAFFAGGRTVAGVDTHLDTPFDYPMYYALLDVLVKGKPMWRLEEALRLDWLYPHPEMLVPFLGNHDQVRFMSLPGATAQLLRLGYGLLMTMRGMPELYAGDEIAMQGGEDPDNRRDFPGGFSGDTANAFTAAGRTPEQTATHDWVAALGALRAKTPALQTGAQQTVLAGETSFAYLRMTAGSACAHQVLVVLNRNWEQQEIAVPVQGTGLARCSGLTPMLGDGVRATISGATVAVKLPGFGFGVYALQ